MYLFIDFETYSSIDLANCGVYRYVESPDFRVTLCGWALDDGEVHVDEGITPDVRKMIENPSIIKVAHNAEFEQTVCAQLGIKTLSTAWIDTMILAASQGLPASLKNLSEVLELGEKVKKNGTKLIKLFAKPPYHSGAEYPSEWDEYKEYNKYDIESERAIFYKINYSITLQERQVQILDKIINRRGCAVDIELVDAAIKAAGEITSRGLAELGAITGLANPNSTPALKKWLASRGCVVDTLRKDDYAGIIERTSDPDVKKALTIKESISKSAVKKFDATARAVCKDGRIRGMTQYYGATRTGRWSGRIVQLQNLKRNSIKNLGEVRESLKRGNFKTDHIEAMEELSQLVRTALVPAEDKKFIVADFSAIEARVIAWLAGETWRQQVFAKDGDIYKSSYSQAFGVPVEEVTKAQRQKGKIMELALGYGGGIGALKAFGADKLGLSDEEMTELVTLWRYSSPSIVDLWHLLENAVRGAIRTGAVTKVREVLTVYREPGLTGGIAVCIELPSKRVLKYQDARIEDGRISYGGVVQASHKWGRIETFGGKLVENVIQAISRDILAIAMIRLENAGFPIVAHIHDEVICECPLGASVSEVERVMGSDQLKGLHLTAKGYQGAFYYKD